MKKVSKAILIGITVLVALAVVLVVGVNLYIQSPASQARIQEELSKSLRVPLKLTNVSVFGGLRVSGITIPNGGANFLEAASFNANYRLLPLLHGQIVISDMTVQNPKIVWAQSADGKWRLPEREAAADIAAKEAPTATKENTGPQVPNAEPSKGDTEKPDKPKKSSFAVVVNRFDVKGGNVELLDHDNKHLAVFSDVNMTYTTLTADKVEGTATIGKIVWADTLALENVSTPFKYADGAIEIPNFDASFAGGKLQAKFQTHEEQNRSPYKLAVTFTRIDLDRISTAFGAQPGENTGILTGQVEIHGDAKRLDRLDGEAHADLRDGQFAQLDLFQNIGQLLGLRELADLRIRDGHTDLRLSDKKVLVDKVLLNSANLQLTAHGTAHLDKHLSLNAQLSAQDGVVQHLPDIIRDAFGPSADGRRAIDFTIKGEIDRMKTDLLDKFTARKIDNQYGDLLSTIFGQLKKPDDDKNKKPDKERKKKDKDKPPAQTSAPPTVPAPQTAPTPAPPTAPVAPPQSEPAAANQ